jgi:hypothetical protein
MLWSRAMDTQGTREAAIRLLKERGIWQRLTDGKHSLRHVYSGIIEIDHLELDETSSSLKITETTHDAMDMPYVAFTLTPGKDGGYDDWFEEGSAVYRALEELMKC